MSIFKLKAESVTAQRKSDLPDMDMVRQAVSLFGDPEHNIFVMSLPSKKWACYSPHALDHICAFVGDSSNGRSMYFTINPTTGVNDFVKDSDVVRRRWLFIDIDRNKTLQPNDPATDQEHEDAKELAKEIAAYLETAGFPSPIMVDSGNGFHLYYRINLPNDQASKTLVRDILNLLDSTFSDARGDVGAECHDAKRFSRLPGTWSRRGEKSKTRPYRMAKIVHVPTEIVVVSEETLRALAGGESEIKGVGTCHPIIPAQPQKGLILKVGPDGDEGRKKAYAKKAIDNECGRVATAPVGERNNQLFKSSAALFGLVAGGLADEQEVQDALYTAAKRCGLADDSGSKEVVNTIESARKAGLKQPRVMPAEVHANGKVENGSDVAKNSETPTRIIVNASEIKPRRVEWIWQGRIPRGKLTTFAGNGGLGKTFVLTDIAARISRGDAWPDGSPGNKPGKVLYVSGEDDPDDTLVPRLIAAGANLDNISFFIPEVLGQFSLADVGKLDTAIKQMGDNVLMVAIDPPTAYLGGVNDHKNSELRGVLTPLASWAGQNKLAVVFISHVSKPQGQKVEAMMRVIGGVAWVNGVRAAHMFAKDPDNPEERLFVGMKSNLGKERKGLKYKLQAVDPDDADGPARVQWLGEVDTTADEACNSFGGGGAKKSRGQRAAEWLVERFREKLEWDSNELFKAGKEEDISRNAIFSAKDLLDLPNARKETRLGGAVTWVWWVPHDWIGFNEKQLSQSSQETNGTVGTVGTVESKPFEF